MSNLDHDEANKALRAFLSDMKQWSDQSFRESRGGKEPRKGAGPYERLAAVVAKHCTPRDVSYLGISYSEESEWDPAEKVVEIEQVGDDRLDLVTVRWSKEDEDEERCRYELLRVDGRWRIDGRYGFVGDTAYADFLAPLLARRTEQLWTLYEQHALETFAKQMHLMTLVGEADWQFDTATGTLSFSNGYRWKGQVLGSESRESFTWLWAWANQASGLPEEILQAALALKRYGEEQGIVHFVEPKLPINEVDAEFIATLASGLLKGKAHYGCPYQSGAAFVLITDPSYPEVPPENVARLKERFERFCTANPSMTRRKALVRFLEEEVDAISRGRPANVDVQYDDQGRVSQVTAKLTPESGGLLGKLMTWLSGGR